MTAPIYFLHTGRPWKGPPDLVQNELPVPVNLTDDGTADPSSTEAEDEDEDDDVIQAKGQSQLAASSRY